ncbi:MAG: hypothetical protein FWE06_09805 [Oscillospiraceae bacterium]|nr:hypothetical protein [Oscillospiraceae bacterium]
MSEKRMIGDTGYEVTNAMWMNSVEILLGENMAAEDGNFYLVCNHKSNPLFSEYLDGKVIRAARATMIGATILTPLMPQKPTYASAQIIAGIVSAHPIAAMAEEDKY